MVSPVSANKIICLPADFARADLGLSPDTISVFRSKLTKVIHCAWAVNFNLNVSSFESQHIRGAHNLISLCLSVNTPQPAAFYFCSSISAAAGTPLPATITETYITQLENAQNMGYARSKLVVENMIKAAVEKTGIIARVCRVGQIIGDSQDGIWNSTEAIPLMIQSATTLGALPELDEVSQSMLTPHSTADLCDRRHPGFPAI
jgi:thioester reductase-like protein